MFGFLKHRIYPELKTNVFGLDFDDPVGLGNGMPGGSFMELSGEVKSAIGVCSRKRPRCLIAANLTASTSSTDEPKLIKDFSKQFALMYDFADFFIINTAVQRLSGGASSLEDISFLSEILDEILSLRLLNDQSKPVLVQVSNAISPDLLDGILDYSLYSGIDGMVVETLPVLSHILEYTRNRMPVVVRTDDLSVENAAKYLDAGASLIELIPTSPRLGRRAVRKIQEYLYASSNHLYDR